MNGREFFLTVARMRRAQRGCASSSIHRREARELEKRVDEEIERMKRILAERKDPLANNL